MSRLLQLGIIFILLGFILTLIGTLTSKTKTNIAFGGFIGPIPFGFMNDPRMFWVLIVLFVLMLILFKLR